MPDDQLMRHPDPSDASASTTSGPAAPSVPALPEETLAQVAGTVTRSRSESTRRNYAADWARFIAWCQREGHAALPAHPLTVAAYGRSPRDVDTNTYAAEAIIVDLCSNSIGQI